MSVLLVDPEHIHVMIRVGLPHAGLVLRWTTDDTATLTHANGLSEPNGTRYRELRPASADVVGQMLLDANAASIAASWGEDRMYVYSYRHPRRTEWSQVEIHKAIDGYTHQSAETPGWSTSEAARFCDALRHLMIRRLPDYDHAPSWTIDEHSVPLAVTRAEIAARHRINRPR